jgi:cellulase/cellobiase CelA1
MKELDLPVTAKNAPRARRLATKQRQRSRPWGVLVVGVGGICAAVIGSGELTLFHSSDSAAVSAQSNQAEASLSSPANALPLTPIANTPTVEATPSHDVTTTEKPASHHRKAGAKAGHPVATSARATTRPKAQTSSKAKTPAKVKTSSCTYTYAFPSVWDGGFVASVTLTNTSHRAHEGWTAQFSMPGTATITQSWGATFVQKGDRVTVTPVAYNTSMAPQAQVVIGFNASTSSTVNSLSSFRLNGSACAHA